MMPRPTSRKYRIAQSQKLREVLNLKLGASTTGKEWCIKALHPSDPFTEVRGIPDQSSQPTTLLNWQMQYSIQPQSGSTGTWNTDITIMPDPVAFGCFNTSDSIGATVGMILNSQLTSSTYDAGRTAFLNMAERWRLAYMGVSIYQDGPDLANQGTCVAASVPVEYSQYPVFAITNSATPLTSAHTSLPGIGFQSNDAPDYTKLIRMPNAYFGQSKAGCYFPMKLSTNHQQWQSNQTMKNDVSGWTAETYDYNIRVPTSEPTSNYPYYGLKSCWVSSGNLVSAPRFAPLNENWGHICFRNMGVTTTLQLVFRVGLELQCNPAQSLAPYLRLSPPYDPVAIHDYFAISRELKDAYPVEYNDWGKLLDVIKKAAAVALPFVRKMGPVGAGIGAIADFVMDATSDRDKPPEASKERAVEQMAAADRPPPLPPRPPRKAAPARRKIKVRKPKAQAYRS